MALLQYASCLDNSNHTGAGRALLPIWTLFRCQSAQEIVRYLISPTVPGILIYGACLGLGYGTYTAVDMAMMVDVLPSGEDAAKDLGVLNLAANIPQTLTPLIAAALLGAFSNNYQVLFIYAAVAVVLSAIFVVPIKKVK